MRCGETSTHSPVSGLNRRCEASRNSEDHAGGLSILTPNAARRLSDPSWRHVFSPSFQLAGEGGAKDGWGAPARCFPPGESRLVEVHEARAVGRRADEHLGMEAEGDPVGVDERRSHALDRFRFHEAHGAAAEAAAGHARAINAFDALCECCEEVDLRAGDLEIVAHRGLRGVHRRPAGHEVARVQRPLGLEHPCVLGDDVAAAAIDEVGKGAAMPLEIARALRRATPRSDREGASGAERPPRRRRAGRCSRRPRADGGRWSWR